MAITLTQAKKNSYYFSTRCTIGLYRKNYEVILFDSGIDTATATSLDKYFIENNLKLHAIFNTHHHADHCGGNNYFQKKYPELKIFATEWEQCFIEQPLLSPVCFCSGAEPFCELKNKFLLPEPSKVTNVITPYQDQTIRLLDEEFKIVTLPGHTNGMIGIITPDNILYCGDAFFNEQTFEKHKVPLYTNITSTIATLKKLHDAAISGCVFYHEGFLENIQSTAQKHIDRVLQTSDLILKFITTKQSTLESLTTALMQHHQISDNMMQFALTKTTIGAYLSYLETEKKIKLSITHGTLQITAL